MTALARVEPPPEVVRVVLLLVLRGRQSTEAVVGPKVQTVEKYVNIIQ